MLLIVLAAIAAFIMSARLDVFERFTALSRAHSEWQVDELATVLVVTAVGVGIFAWRRWRELRVER